MSEKEGHATVRAG